MNDQLVDSIEGRKKILEAALLASERPLTARELSHLFDEKVDDDHVRILLDELRGDWQGRGVLLTPLADGWRFMTNPDYQSYLGKLQNERAPRYSRATLETMAIIAYRQPLTRGEIEEIRGVSVSSAIIKTLESRGWIEVVGHRNTPGQPALYATTNTFLNDLMLRSLEELPSLQDIEDALEKSHNEPLLEKPAATLLEDEDISVATPDAPTTLPQ